MSKRETVTGILVGICAMACTLLVIWGLAVLGHAVFGWTA